MSFVWAIVLFIGAIVVDKVVKKLLNQLATTKLVAQKRVFYIEKVFSIMIFFMAVVLFFVLLGIDYRGLLVFASSVFAVVGVALFAQWSILSNITSSIIIFFNFPARIGDTIKIIDGDDSFTAKIVEITLFQVELIDKEENRIFYPNNLLLQKPVILVKSV